MKFVYSYMNWSYRFIFTEVIDIYETFYQMWEFNRHSYEWKYCITFNSNKEKVDALGLKLTAV